MLYVVATPIGNLEDITLRGLRVLREVDVVAAEDTRHTRVLLAHYGIDKPLVSYYDAVERARTTGLVGRMVAGARVALVTDAGTPGVQDPGYHLVRGAVAAGVPVVPVPGASSVTALVSVAGLPADRFVFEGFLPTRPGPRTVRLRALEHEPRAIVFLEAARRLDAFLAAAYEVLGEREAVVARELTKRHEELLRGPLSTLRAELAARDRVRGEVTVLVAGAAGLVEAPAATLDDELRAALAAGTSLRDAAAAVARRTGRSRREVYQRALALTRGGR